MTIIPERGGQDFVGHDVILVAADTDSTLATVYRMALVIALEEFLVACRFSAPSWRLPGVASGHGRASASIKR